MSGIAGVFHRDGRPVDLTALLNMSSALAYRGRDDSGQWVDGMVGLVHRMLWTTPESLYERLPRSSSVSGCVITADARIDNRDELIEQLGLRESSLSPLADSDLILASYEKWKEECPARLIGDFAFAVWNPADQTLFCARDHLGTRPLYYYSSERSFFFASEMKCLLKLPNLPHLLNESRIAGFIQQQELDDQSTFFCHIHRLPPAHHLVVSRERMQIRKYWSLDPQRELNLGSRREYREAFLALFEESVRCRLRSTFPVASALSGGLDSSSITCTAAGILARKNGERLHTVSAIFPSMPEQLKPRIDERFFMDAVLSRGGFLPHFVRGDRIGPFMHLDRNTHLNDEPIANPNLFLTVAGFEAAQREGARVFLDGFDGDTTVSYGCEHLTELAAGLHFKKLMKAARGFARHSIWSWKRILWEYAAVPFIPDVLLSLLSLGRKAKQREPYSDLLSPGLARSIAFAPANGTGTGHRLQSIPAARREHWKSLVSPLIPEAFELTGKIAAYHSIEPRYPFFDRRLVEFCLALPSELKFGDGWTRGIMRQAMEGILPGEIQWRPTKANLGLNFQRNLLNIERNRLEEVVFNDQALAGFYNMPVLRKAFSAFTSNAPGYGNEDQLLFRAVCLSRWLQAIRIYSIQAPT